MKNIKSQWPFLLIATAALLAGLSFLNMKEAMFNSGCRMNAADDQGRLLCKKLAHAFSWGFKADVAGGDEIWRFDNDLNRYQPDSVKVDKSKYLQ